MPLVIIFQCEILTTNSLILFMYTFLIVPPIEEINGYFHTLLHTLSFY
jgi:hypothetical protein